VTAPAATLVENAKPASSVTMTLEFAAPVALKTVQASFAAMTGAAARVRPDAKAALSVKTESASMKACAVHQAPHCNVQSI
jgi:hypothetical protein